MYILHTHTHTHIEHINVNINHKPGASGGAGAHTVCENMPSAKRRGNNFSKFLYIVTLCSYILGH